MPIADFDLQPPIGVNLQVSRPAPVSKRLLLDAAAIEYAERYGLSPKLIARMKAQLRARR